MVDFPKANSFDKVEVHPLVLLSVTDHFNRVVQGTKKRVVGCLLGDRSGTTLNVTNSFAVPFDEEERVGTWFLDYNFLEDMYNMFRRVNAGEKIIGWYTTGPKLRNNDIDIHSLFYKYTNDPVMCIIRVGEDADNIPTESYAAVDVAQQDGRSQKEFVHVMSSIVASEAEAVGVEHLLREIQDISLSTLTSEVRFKLTGLRGLAERLRTIRDYIESVVTGQLPINQEILQNLQLIFNHFPNLNKVELIKSFAAVNNDDMLNIYIASLMRSVLALDSLLENKLTNKYNEDKKEQELRDALKKGKEAKDGDKDKEADKENSGDEKNNDKDKDKKKK